MGPDAIWSTTCFLAKKTINQWIIRHFPITTGPLLTCCSRFVRLRLPQACLDLLHKHYDGYRHEQSGWVGGTWPKHVLRLFHGVFLQSPMWLLLAADSGFWMSLYQPCRTTPWRADTWFFRSWFHHAERLWYLQGEGAVFHYLDNLPRDMCDLLQEGHWGRFCFVHFMFLIFYSWNGLVSTYNVLNLLSMTSNAGVTHEDFCRRAGQSATVKKKEIMGKGSPGEGGFQNAPQLFISGLIDNMVAQ